MQTEMNESIGVIRSYCDAWIAGDTMAVVAMYHDDLTLEWPGRHRLAGTHSGQQASIKALLDLQAITNRVPTKIVQVLGGPESVIAIVVERWTAPGDPSETLEHTRALEFTVQDNQLHTCRIFETAQREIDDWIFRQSD